MLKSKHVNKEMACLIIVLDRFLHVCNLYLPSERAFETLLLALLWNYYLCSILTNFEFIDPGNVVVEVSEC